MVDIRILVPCNNTLGEGPLWDVEEERLYWVDSMERQIWRCRADGSEVAHWNLPAVIGSLALRQKGGAVVALESGLHFFDFATGALTFIAHPEEGKENVRLNDGKVDPEGRFVVGSLDMEYGLDPNLKDKWRGRFFRLDPDLSLHVLAEQVAIANGPCWSPDGRTFYYTKTIDRKIRACVWKDGAPSGERILTRCPEAKGIPDGATVDADGCLWSTMNGAYSGEGSLSCYTPDGALKRSVRLPTARPTSLMFGGPNLDILYVTTLNLPASAAPTPYDGKLLAIHGLGVKGLPERRFAG